MAVSTKGCTAPKGSVMVSQKLRPRGPAKVHPWRAGPRLGDLAGAEPVGLQAASTTASIDRRRHYGFAHRRHRSLRSSRWGRPTCAALVRPPPHESRCRVGQEHDRDRRAPLGLHEHHPGLTAARRARSTRDTAARAADRRRAADICRDRRRGRAPTLGGPRLPPRPGRRIERPGQPALGRIPPGAAGGAGALAGAPPRRRR